ncbi:MAG: cytochrome-c peroxidase [Bacteroidota bacterium]|nr:cytochrome-c peroxidase [Bacteroidota bacterium]
MATGCRPDPPDPPAPPPGSTGPTPYGLQIPENMPPMLIPANNPLTVEGVKLGRHLFYEERLSGNNTLSCASCHAPENAFSDQAQFSTGIDGIMGTRQSMALMNLGWETSFFWDGRAATLEDQILQPVIDPIEMHDNWPNVIYELQSDPAYEQLFDKAFGTPVIDSVNAAKAIAQFLRTMISANSRFDKFMRGDIQLEPEEALGFELTQLEGGDPVFGQGGQLGADCFHCHPHGGGRFTDGAMRNNGLDETFTDQGLGGITGLAQDMGKFKTPSLRNVALSAPYMHDGRFQTLEEVIDHYDSGGHPSPTIDPNMKFTQGGLQLTPEKKAQLIAFLNTLTDMEFVNDARFQDPGPP